MGTQVVKQPNGLYAIFSSNVDGITHYDMSREDYIELRTQQAVVDAKRNAECVLQDADEYGSSAVRPFNETWESAYKRHLEMGYDPIELKVSDKPTTEEVVYLGREGLRKHHPALYDEIMREEAASSVRLDGDTHVLYENDPETCPHDDFETEGATHCSKCGKDMRFYPRAAEEKSDG